jgi:hypothetical protein
VNLKVDIDEGNALEVTGFALFYVVRGDSAAIPPELYSRGFRPDSLRWWIERWEDETLAPEGLVAIGDGLSMRPVGTWTVRHTGPGPAATSSTITPMTMAELKRYFAGLPALHSAAAAARSAERKAGPAPAERRSRLRREPRFTATAVRRTSPRPLSARRGPAYIPLRAA